MNIAIAVIGGLIAGLLLWPLARWLMQDVGLGQSDDYWRAQAWAKLSPEEKKRLLDGKINI
ncbi:MAG: hypothetical protein JWR69_925 [Pedosphaera sp.]|nr:hypothetical protein [Pedosphaera sp.]